MANLRDKIGDKQITIKANCNDKGGTKDKGKKDAKTTK